MTKTKSARPNPMTPPELRRLGKSLYGPAWKTKLAAVLPVSDRSIRYWLAGRKMHPAFAARIRALAKAKRS